MNGAQTAAGVEYYCAGHDDANINLLSKLQVENRAQAIVLSLKRGLVSLEDLQQ